MPADPAPAPTSPAPASPKGKRPPAGLGGRRRPAKDGAGGKDPRQNAKLAALGLGVAALAYVYLGRGGPDPAAATNGAETIDVSGGGRVRVPAVTDAARRVAAWRGGPIPDLGRNLFARPTPDSPAEAEPAPPVAPPPERPAGTGEAFDAVRRGLDAVAAAGAELARRREARAADAASVLALAGGLEVETILAGRVPKVLLGGEIRGVGGDAGNGMTIEHIDARGLTLRRGEVRVRLDRDGGPARLVTAAPVVSADGRIGRSRPPPDAAGTGGVP